MSDKNKNRFLPVVVMLLLLPLAAGAAEIVLSSQTLSVTVDDQFPRIISYQHQSGGKKLHGQSSAVSAVTLNGKVVPCDVSFRKVGSDSGRYTLSFPEQKITVHFQIDVGSNVVDLDVTSIKEEGSVKFMDMAFPGNALLSVSTTEKGVSIAAVVVGRNGIHSEIIEDLTDMKGKGSQGNYFFMATDSLAAGLASNLVDGNRTAWGLSRSGEVVTCKAWCPKWKYREIESETIALPWAKVFITPDRNGDNTATWHDAAMVYRQTMPAPYGHEVMKKAVGCQVAMNFASGVQQPFLRILDACKKMYLATDGLMQDILIKGYTAEGHDSANTDYGGNYNERAGGLEDLTILLEKAKKYNARIGVHINATEVYPEALRYDPAILQYDKNGEPDNAWSWLDQSHRIDKRKDILTGNLYASLELMRREMPALDFVYVDTYRGCHWNGWKLVDKLNGMGLPVYTEIGGALDPWTTWSHARMKDRQIVPFIWYSKRDIFADDPILRAADHKGFLSWGKQFNFHVYIEKLFEQNLPAKYLQHFELLRHTPGKEAVFTDGVHVTVQGDRVVVTQHGRKVMQWSKGEYVTTKRKWGDLKNWSGGAKDTKVFVPWESDGEAKIYLWDSMGGKNRWQLPPDWQTQPAVFMYPLSDTGRGEEIEVTVHDGWVSPTVAKDTAYVIYPARKEKQEPLDWSEGRTIADAGFDSHGLAYWSVTPQDSGSVQVENDPQGNPRLVVGPSSESLLISQKLEGLEPGGTYAASVWVQVDGERLTTLEVLPLGVENPTVASNYVLQCDVKHNMPCDMRQFTRYQRIKVVLDLPDNCTSVQLAVRVASGNTKVEMDDFRIVKTGRSPRAAEHWFFEDFENVDQGYGPFTCSYKEGTHLAENNPPYTKDTINGRFSLKTRDPGFLRTLPSTVRLKPWMRYRLAIESKGINGGKGRIEVKSAGETVLQGDLNGRMSYVGEFSTKNDDNSFITIALINSGDGAGISFDDLAIDELGPVAEDDRSAELSANEPPPGHRVILEETFAKPLDQAWRVYKSSQHDIKIGAGLNGLEITAPAHVSAFIERDLVPGVDAVECQLDASEEWGLTWGTGLALLWENGNAVRINVRNREQIGVDAFPGGVKNVPVKAASAERGIRIRLTEEHIIMEAAGDKWDPWKTLRTLSRADFPGSPDRVRIGKTHGPKDTTDHTHKGKMATAVVRRFLVYEAVDKQ